jgi:hypothetical protein
MDKRLDCIWVLGPVALSLGALMQSAARYPNIKPGQEFTGYELAGAQITWLGLTALAI